MFRGVRSAAHRQLAAVCSRALQRCSISLYPSDPAHHMRTSASSNKMQTSWGPPMVRSTAEEKREEGGEQTGYCEPLRRPDALCTWRH
ncbi:unnamed protein product [Arctogadus glacialis]